MKELYFKLNRDWDNVEEPWRFLVFMSIMIFIVTVSVVLNLHVLFFIFTGIIILFRAPYVLGLMLRD